MGVRGWQGSNTGRQLVSIFSVRASLDMNLAIETCAPSLPRNSQRGVCSSAVWISPTSWLCSAMCLLR